VTARILFLVAPGLRAEALNTRCSPALFGVSAGSRVGQASERRGLARGFGSPLIKSTKILLHTARNNDMLAANASRYGVFRFVDKTDGRKLLDTADIVRDRDISPIEYSNSNPP